MFTRAKRAARMLTRALPTKMVLSIRIENKLQIVMAILKLNQSGITIFWKPRGLIKTVTI